MIRNILLLSLLSAARPPLSAPGIHWEASLETTLEQAAAESRVVFVAVNMDGEAANDRMAAVVYADKRVCALAERTLNLVASISPHTKSGSCPRFGSISCEAHRQVEEAVRKAYLKPGPDARVIAPMHVFLDSKGAVILSVPYAISAEELEWCFATALRQLDPKLDLTLSPGARAPKRVVLGAIADGGETSEPAPSSEEVQRLIKEIRKGSLQGGERLAAILRLLASDEPDAIDMVRTELRGGGAARGGKGAGRGGGGGGDPWRAKRRIVHRMGVISPPAYWEVAVEQLESTDEELRQEAIAALEQLAAPQSLKDIKAALRKARDARTEGGLVRALASAGAADKRTRAELLERCSKKDETALRVAAVLALGHLAPNEEVAAALRGLLEDVEGEEVVRAAAACAMALSRDPAWSGALQPLLDSAPGGALGEVCAAAVQALKAGSLVAIRPAFLRISGDQIVRERFFGGEGGD